MKALGAPSRTLAARKHLSQTAVKNNVAVVRIAALRAGLARRNFRSMQHCIAERLQPAEGGFFDDGFGERRHSRPPR